MAQGSLKTLWPGGGLWRHADFLKLWGGQTVSEFGSQVTLLALPYAAVKVLHASAFAVASLTIFEQLPFLLFALPAGVWVDRLRRRPLLVIGDLGRALALSVVPIAYAAGVLRTWQLFAVAFATGVLTVFFDVAYQSYLPSLVGRNHLVEANSKLQVSAAASQTGGPGPGGVLIAVVSAPYAILVDIASFIASALFVLRIRTREVTTHRIEARPTMRTELMEGLRYVLSNRYLRPIAACTAARNFFAAVGYAILMVYVVRSLGLSAGLIGVIISCANVGFVIGALTAGWTTRRLGIGRAIVYSAAIVGSSVILIPLSPRSFPVPLIVVGLMLYSYGGVVFNITQISLRQAITPDRLQGRMNAVMRFILWGAIPLGALLGGALASTVGLRAALWVSGAGVATSWLPVFFSPVRTVTGVPEAPPEETFEQAGFPAPTGVDTPGLTARTERAPADA
jgi:MFS family permease